VGANVETRSRGFTALAALEDVISLRHFESGLRVPMVVSGLRALVNIDLLRFVYSGRLGMAKEAALRRRPVLVGTIQK